MIRRNLPMDAGRLGGIAAAMAYISILGLGYGMMYPLLTVLLEAQGESGVLIGISTMASPAGAIVITPLLPAILRRYGLPSLMAFSAASEIAMYLCLFLFQDVWSWMPFRVILGVSGSIAFFGSEYWIVAMARDGQRGRVVGVYALFVAGSLGIGPLILSVIGFAGFLPFAIPMLLCAAGTVPVFLARRQAPRFSGKGALMEVPRFITANPTICFAVILFGALEAGLLGLVPAWGVRSGIGPEAAVTLIAIAGFGTVAIQPLLGPASDRWSRRLMLGLCALSCAALMVSMALLVGNRLALWAAFFAWGGLSAGLYTVALVELGARYGGRELAVGNAAVIMGYSIGAVFGPLVAGAMMDAIPPHGMLYSLVGGCLIYLALLSFRGAEVRRTGK